jgi:hypothetical protein
MCQLFESNIVQMNFQAYLLICIFAISGQVGLMRSGIFIKWIDVLQLRDLSLR